MDCPGAALLGELRLDRERPVLLRHVADIEMSSARANRAFRIEAGMRRPHRVPGGRRESRAARPRVRARIDSCAKVGSLRHRFRIGFDAAETVEKQIDA